MVELHFLEFENMQYISCQEKVIYFELTDTIENVIYKIKQNILKLDATSKIMILNNSNGIFIKEHETIADCNVIDKDNMYVITFDNAIEMADVMCKLRFTN